MMYAYILAAPQHHADFARAEFNAFTGQETSSRMGLADFAADISHAAFISTCIRVEASGESLQAMCADAREENLAWEGFRIQRFAPTPGFSVNTMDAIIATANAITGHPDLDNPTVVLGLIATPDWWGVGPVISRYRQDWPAHEDRPNFFSGSLPTRFARGMINLVAAPGDTLIDPCCGVGVPLIEALSIGVEAVGCDLNGRIIKQAAENLEAVGMPKRVFVADARELSGHFDAAVLDLPYGRNVPVTEGLYGDLLRKIHDIADRAAIVSAEDLSATLTREFDFQVGQHIRIPKNNMVRHLHVVVPAH
ncbi:MAG: hypothetical protein R6V19_02460 [Armatimonadota bacterium]